ncbi:MAG TPA: sialidase family protein [Chloroflexota bacterium]|nr:sialidase family protein [Chloroflexota bacterium]
MSALVAQYGKGAFGRPPRLLVMLCVAAAFAVLGAGLLGGMLITRPGPVEEAPNVDPEYPVTAMDQSVGLSNNSPRLVADPLEPRFVVMANRLDAPDFGCALQLSGDAGETWAPGHPVTELPDGTEKCYAPEVGFDRQGTLYYLFIGLAGRGNEPMGAFLTTSTDRGRTFSAPRRILGPLSFGVRMAIDHTMGDGRLHLVWLQATSETPLGGFGPPPNPILTAYSDDGGNTFSEPVRVSDGFRERVVAPALAIGPNRAVYVGYYDLEDDAVDYQGLEGATWEGTWSIVLATSEDGGRHFRPGVIVDGDIVPSERVMLIFTMPPASLAVHGERVCAAWTDGRNGDPDAVSRCSHDKGRTWEQLRRLNDDTLGNGKHQSLPQLATAPDGRLDAVFFDRRADPRNILRDVYFTYSTDGGRHFAPNLPVTTRGFDSRIGQRYGVPSAQGQIEWGSRLGLLSRGTDALAAWPDTRNSRPQSTAQDLFTAQIHIPVSTTEWTRIMGAALLAVGVFVGAGVGARSIQRSKRSALMDTELPPEA